METRRDEQKKIEQSMTMRRNKRKTKSEAKAEEKKKRDVCNWREVDRGRVSAKTERRFNLG